MTIDRRELLKGLAAACGAVGLVNTPREPAHVTAPLDIDDKADTYVTEEEARSYLDDLVWVEEFPERMAQSFSSRVGLPAVKWTRYVGETHTCACGREADLRVSTGVGGLCRSVYRCEAGHVFEIMKYDNVELVREVTR